MSNTIQAIVMTSDKYTWLLPGFMTLWQKYWCTHEVRTVVCGFTRDSYIDALRDVDWYSIGEQDRFPAGRWSDAFKRVLDNVAEETFVLMLEDYYLARQVDHRAVQLLQDYMQRNPNVLKVDLCHERLYSHGGGRYLYGYNTYAYCGHLDLIQSPKGSQYQMSLWGGLFRRDLLRQLLVPGETAQQVELEGTTRLNAVTDDIIVLGTRQGPIRHINLVQNGRVSQDELTGLKALTESDINYLRNAGYRFEEQ